MPEKHLSIEDEFHLRLGRLTHAAAVLDFNVGLTLKWLAERLNEDVTADLKPTSPFGGRLRKLRTLFLNAYGNSHPGLRSDFEDWFKRADDARSIRNDYAHARWGFRYSNDHGDKFIGFVPLNWDMDSASAPQQVWLSPSQLDLEVSELQKLSGDFQRLTKKYGEYIHIR